MSGDELRLPLALRARDEELEIEWDDGVCHSITWAELRANCPCAGCVNRPAGNRPADSAPTDSHDLQNELQILTPQEAQPVKLSRMQPVGNYAYGLSFSDGHSTGIYTLEHLRAIGERTD